MCRLLEQFAQECEGAAGRFSALTLLRKLL